MLVVAVIAACFLAFSDLTCFPKDTEIGVFWLHFLSDSKDTKLGGSIQKASPSTDKNTGVILVSCRAWKYAPTATLSELDIPEVPRYHLLRRMSSQWVSQTLFQG